MSADSKPRYEPTDALPRVVGGLGAGLAVLVLLGLAAGWLYLDFGPPKAAGTPEATAFAEGAHYQTSVEASWAEYQRDMRSHLNGYGWVDRPAGVVRIPIERAIDLITAPSKAGQPAGKQGGGP